MSIFKLILGQRAPPFSYILSSRSLLSTPTTAEPTLLASRLVLLILASLASCSLSRCSFVGRRRLRVACHEINGKRFTFRIYLIVRWRRKFSSANSLRYERFPTFPVHTLYVHPLAGLSYVSFTVLASKLLSTFQFLLPSSPDPATRISIFFFLSYLFSASFHFCRPHISSCLFAVLSLHLLLSNSFYCTK